MKTWLFLRQHHMVDFSCILSVCTCAKCIFQDVRSGEFVITQWCNGLLIYWTRESPPWALPLFYLWIMLKDRCWFMLHIYGCDVVRRGSWVAWGGWDWFEWMMNLQLNVSRVDGADFCVQLHAVLMGRMRSGGASHRYSVWFRAEDMAVHQPAQRFSTVCEDSRQVT